MINKDESIRQMDSLGGVFRVVPTTPRVAEVTVATAIASPTVDAGKFVHLIHIGLFVTRKLKSRILESSQICSFPFID